MLVIQKNSSTALREYECIHSPLSRIKKAFFVQSVVLRQKHLWANLGERLKEFLVFATIFVCVLLANLPSPPVMMIGLGAVIAMVVLLLNLELSNFLDVQNNKKYVRLKICLPGFGEYSCNKFPLITIRPRIREPFTLERLHLFNFLYFLYFSAGPLFLTHFSDRSSSQRRTVLAPEFKVGAK